MNTKLKSLNVIKGCFQQQFLFARHLRAVSVQKVILYICYTYESYARLKPHDISPEIACHIRHSLSEMKIGAERDN